MRSFNQRVIFCLSFLILLFQGKVWSVPQTEIELRSFIVNEFPVRNQNWSISQSPKTQQLFFANSEGLYKFNGISWQRHITPGNFSIRSVLAYQNGDIFTGSFEEFGYWRHNDAMELEYHSLAGLADVEKNDEIWKIHALGDKVYFQSFTSIYIYDFDEIIKVKSPYTMLFTHKVDEQLVVQILANGLFWFIDNEFIQIPGSELFANKRIHSIIPYVDHRWIICTDDSGLYLFDGTLFTFLRSEASEFLSRFTCNVAVKLADSTFAFGSILNGVIITDQYGNIQRSYNTRNGLRNNTVLSLLTDNDNGLWIGLDEGVNYIDILSPLNHYKGVNGSLGTVYALLEHNNVLYMGTNHGLFIADIAKKTGFYFFENLRFVQGSQGQVWTLAKLEDQIICGHNDGFFLVKRGRLQQISTVTGGWTIRPMGDLLIGGTYTGIVFFEPGPAGEWRFRNKVQGFNEPVRYLEMDYLGYVWATHHQKGLYRIELSGDFRSVSDVQFIPSIDSQSFNLRVYKVNNRVLFTNGNDIYTFDFVRNEIVPFETLSLYLEEYRMATQIIHHQKNQYWFIRDDRLALFEISLDFKATKKYEIFQEIINLPQRSIQLVNLDDNTLLIPTPHSFDILNIQLAQQQKNISRLSIDRIIFHGRKGEKIWTDFFRPTAAPHHMNNLKVNFSDPSWFSNTSKRYQYRIQEIDPSWQVTSNDHFSFLSLKNGDYTLELRREGGPIETIEFSINKPWYLSIYMILVYLMVLGALGWEIVRFSRFEIKRHKDVILMEIKQNQLEKELDYKSYELMLTMRHLILKDDILNDIQKQIDAIKDQSSKYPVKYIRNMEKIISQGLGTQNIEWENAMQNLKLTQQGFFKVLKEKYPSLTSNDLKLCSYLRLNFNTKEIAQLLNVSTRAVEISRHRLRKKLKLSHEENLFDFLIRMEEMMNES